MKVFLKALLISLCGLCAAIVILFSYLFFSARPENKTDPAVLQGDGASINYCQLPNLDNSNKSAIDIAKGNTPSCGYSHFPLPILGDCTEPLATGAQDIRGLWQAIPNTMPGTGVSDEASNSRAGHVERIEQCGNRTVITTAGVIHDYGPNSTGVLNTDDTEGSVLFTIGNKEYCNRTSASMVWNEGKLDFHAFGWGPVVVRRYLENDQLIWEYADGSVTRMERICTLPESHKYPKPRGPRYAF